MLRVLPFLLQFVLLVYCLVEIVRTPNLDARNLPRWAWLLLVILLPLVGCIAWLVAGRPKRGPGFSTWVQGAGFPEDDRPAKDTSDVDQALQAELDRVDREFDEAVRRKAAEERAKAQRDLNGDHDGRQPGPIPRTDSDG